VGARFPKASRQADERSGANGTIRRSSEASIHTNRLRRRSLAELESLSLGEVVRRRFGPGLGTRIEAQTPVRKRFQAFPLEYHAHAIVVASDCSAKRLWIAQRLCSRRDDPIELRHREVGRLLASLGELLERQRTVLFEQPPTQGDQRQ